MKKGIPKDKKQANEFIEELRKTYNLLLQWIEDFKTKFSQHPESSPTISQVENSFKLYRKIIGASEPQTSTKASASASTPVEATAPVIQELSVPERKKAVRPPVSGTLEDLSHLHK